MAKKPTASNVTAEQLREHLTAGRRVSCLNELSDEHLVETFAMLKSNTKQWNYSAIARHILNTWGVLVGYKDSWIAAQLKIFADKSLGPRRGLKKARKDPEVTKLLQRKADSIRKSENKVKKQLNEMAALGEQMETIQEELEYWTARGQERGEPFDVYVPKLLTSMAECAKLRHAMKIDYGLVKPAAPKENESIIKALFMSIQGKIDNPSQMTGILGAMKNGIAAIAENAPTELLEGNHYGSELQHQDCVEIESARIPCDIDVGVEPLPPEPGDM